MRHCDECNKDQSVKESKVTRNYIINGKSIPVELTLLVCDECGCEVYDEDYNANQMATIRHTYDKLFGMTTEEIRAVRAQYKGIGSRPFAKLLGIGSASLTRHESGDMPSDKHLEIYRELRNDPSRIWGYFEKNKGVLSPRELKKTIEILEAWKSGQAGILQQDDEEIIEAIHKPYEYSQLSGNISFNLNKFIQMILFFARSGVNKTKLMKLLFYSDFIRYKWQTVSISGAVYTRFPFGPVPKDHEIMLAHLQRMDIISIEEKIVNDEGWILMTVKAKQEFNPNVFTPEELDVLKIVDEKFFDFKSRQISDYAHKERAWIETDSEQPISYSMATDLREFSSV
ncbi:type II toxin-antitoxin system antitoxin SocA domain-containing protein [Paenibacillus oryzisoli]|uniref:type II toxin-antitoxin system antitoxin SocA domain-containing protein n=1 Tax=Paenibacillus oryzisoli TaxID=1850517 RepID=UPI003D2A71B9